MTVGRGGRLALLVAGLLAAFAVAALAHTESGGGGNDTLQGHDHSDWLYGNSGCDDLLGRGAADYLQGGPSGCDKARGMEGAPDAAVVWDDNVGNDEAYGGAGSPDQCYVGHQDYYDSSSCEAVYFP
jgi:RTX calcium-binding nonapeptide repeat (4 copies)